MMASVQGTASFKAVDFGTKLRPVFLRAIQGHQIALQATGNLGADAFDGARRSRFTGLGPALPNWPSPGLFEVRLIGLRRPCHSASSAHSALASSGSCSSKRPHVHRAGHSLSTLFLGRVAIAPAAGRANSGVLAVAHLGFPGSPGCRARREGLHFLFRQPPPPRQRSLTARGTPQFLAQLTLTLFLQLV